MFTERKLLPEGDTYIEYIPMIPPELQLNRKSYAELWDTHPTEFGNIVIYGKHIATPRWFQNYGNEYIFSGIKHSALPIPQILVPFIDYANAREKTDIFNGILVNWYQDGKHYIGKHSDDEKTLIKNTPIYVFSMGSERDFIIESKREPSTKYKYTTLNNSLLIMGGECQKYYKHTLPKRANINNSRISITVRAFK